MTDLKPDQRLIDILLQLDDTPVDTVKKQNAEYLLSIQPVDLVLAEQQFFDQGISSKEIDAKLPQHIKLLLNPSEPLESLPAGHILKRLIAEHRQIDYLLDEITDLKESLKKITRLSAYSPEFKTLIHIASHVSASSNHGDIEEKLIFPAFQQAGMEVLPRILKAHHFQNRIYSREFFDLAFSGYANLALTAQKFEEIGNKFFPSKKHHMMIEETLLYPASLEIIDEKTWENLKQQCESIGFCCFQI